jgi:hypothetical protein
MTKLTYEMRKELPKGDFVFPKTRRYPIEDAAHARDALARSSGILSHAAPYLRQPVADYFQSNIHCTTSGYFTLPPLRCALEVIGIDRLLCSVDYPYSPNTRGRAFLDSLPEILEPVINFRRAAERGLRA